MTKKCPYCKNKMEKEEKVCQVCGKKYPSKIATVLTTIILVFIIVEFGSCVGGCFSDDDASQNEITEINSITSVIVKGTESDNPLMSCDVVVSDVLNGSMDNVIGKRAEIHATKNVVDNLSSSEFHEFAENVVMDKEYSWFTINYDDGTGICFVGAKTSTIEYGTLDSEGRIDTFISDIKY